MAKKAALVATANVYDRVTAQIVASLEQGVLPWVKPWSVDNSGVSLRPLRANGQPYRGINVLMLWGAATNAGYTSPHWMTFKQAQEFGGCVRKGEHGTLVVYANRFVSHEINAATGEDTERSIPFLKGYTVFNADQIDGLPERFAASTSTATGPERIERAEQFTTATGAVIQHGGNKAYYNRSRDAVQMPPIEAFQNAEAYYGTLAHELTHWSGHTTRLDRMFGTRFGDDAYAFEELVAELGSAFVCADLGIATGIQSHAEYLAVWLKILKGDKRAIFTAASLAQRAADFLLPPPPANEALDLAA